MGAYTELIIKADVVRCVPPEVVGVLNFLFNAGTEPSTLPDHRFFTLERWRCIGRCSSHYHVPWTSSGYEDDILFSRSDLKNYAGEIEAFLEWIDPWLAGAAGKCVGWMCYEQGTPRLIFKQKEAQRWPERT